ncbi:MAG: fused response regulator/phosphatase [Gammaproteobacteria bacterium]|jgi:serine phosphatase RsbU (regulator of sigma subunit)|nr:fused response regulator/phosphatase [Gammaproteobacteria bacterium]PJE56998.1 histidine kinase [Marinomonas sp. BSi20584]MBU1465621.1 fused response regulator/phosphatase [Gammaproteobacteria bacterium]MBU2021710.1 fused response regulator/phosphatase [Gammaproteobacteria bacterium]MBU2237328.1 fused response regulator/phosphatase [Gammaproteobacteria bacterium]|tara:strand:- start:38993 stop:40144 length:1152 start_codon:yes stop_codon:yes gene_type:complete
MMKLLCVDSEPVYREIISLCAEKEGVKVKSVASYEEAILAFENYAPDIVTLDVIVKGGSGYNLVQKLKALSGSRFVPMIFLASHTADSVMDKCFKAGADDFIPKPFNEVLFNIRLKTHMRHVELMKEMYRKNKALTYYQTMIEREHEMAHHVLDHIQTRSEKNSEQVAITRLSAASFNGDLALVKTRADAARLVFVGDFTGHGLPASIGALPVMQTFFDAVDDLVCVNELAVRINRILFSILPDYMFCAGYLILMTQEGEITYWGGGMPNAFIRRSNSSVDYLQSNHMPLGILSATEFEADLQSNKLNAGDTLIIVSDGVLELKNCHEEMLGDNKVKTLISNAYSEKSLITAQQIIEQQLAEYLGESEQLDDITLVALRSPCL